VYFWHTAKTVFGNSAAGASRSGPCRSLARDNRLALPRIVLDERTMHARAGEMVKISLAPPGPNKAKWLVLPG
jgi:hypothetical protein